MDPTSIPNSLSLSLFFQQNLWPILEKICMEQVQFCLVQWLAVSTRDQEVAGSNLATSESSRENLSLVLILQIDEMTTFSLTLPWHTSEAD